ncbi:receptor-type tyrosine-protein phosphatase alpha-like [Liolophura sinensis]|uniref:receptor-type tyrosine-protein phosphatase alpha-like n=1 Tax=Liolophura sinensis TaxID=3198878 RepID=UPI0031587EF1
MGNVALNQQTSQSSDYRPKYLSKLAVDGKAGHALENTPCTHTKSDLQSWWSVTLNRTYNIYRFQIYNRVGNCNNRPDTCGHRLNGFTLSVGTNSQSYDTCYTDTTTTDEGPGKVINGRCNDSKPRTGNTVRISLPSNSSTPLTLCEVRLFVCSEGWYGEMCDKECVTDTCCYQCDDHGFRCEKCVNGRWGTDCGEECGHCWNNTACDKDNSECPNLSHRCESGFHGYNCTTTCPGGTFGDQCREECGQCKDGNHTCDHVNGTCTSCADGWLGDLCKEACPGGTFGDQCREECGQCKDGNHTCDHVNGTCTSCADGWLGDLCKEACPGGTFGDQCREECGQCKDGNHTCDHVNGTCTSCADGWLGDLCKEVCSSYRWGPNCNKTCGECHGGAVCDKVSGVCPKRNPRCATGYTGSRCTPCDPGRWGDNCVNTCSDKCISPACNVTTGVCEAGCHPGYTGEHCDTDAPLTSSSAVGVSVGVSVLVLILIVIVVVVLIIRRRRSGRFRNSNTALQPSRLMFGPQHDDPVPTDNIGNDGEDEDAAADVAAAGFANPGAFQESTRVLVEEFRRYMLRKKASVGFKTEFETLPVGLHAKHDEADKPENKLKSRYRNLVAYDHSRVHLKKFGERDTDYINACYINGYNEPKKYIASQGPTDVIINEFMRMIWEQNTGKVVMVTNLVEKTKTKCYQYWPDEGSKRFGSIRVSLLDEESFANYVIRTLQLTHLKVQNKTRIVKQFHFTTWPDHGAPSNVLGLLEFLGTVLGYQSSLNGPVVVHCSAGIGRTGTFIALDYLINQAKEEGVVDVPACVRLLREQRVNMVQSLEQYKFLHEALAEALELQEGSIPGVNFSSVFADLCTVNPETGQLEIAEQFQRLNEKTSPLDKATLVTALRPDNLHKNRSDKIVAADTCRPYLSTPVAGKSNYINAVFLPSYKMKRGFIITQTPLPETLVDFWRLVYDHGIATIVMLDDVDNESEDVGIYWTEKRKTFGPFDVKCMQKEEERGFTVWTYNLTYKDMKVPRPVKQFRCGLWSSTHSRASIPSLLAVIDGVTRQQEETGNQPIVVHCRDGLTNSGLFCAASFVLERLKLDRDVNIPQAVKQMRVARPQIITDLDQFQFLHEVALEYLETMHTYANYK